MSYDGKIVWITGASSGIGAALAVELASEGARLVLSARRVNRLEKVRDRCAHSDVHLILPLDVTDTHSHQAAFNSIIERFGKLDVLIVNAGIGQRGLIRNSALDIERRIMEVNFFGCISLTHIVLPHFLDTNSGQFVVISSVMGKVSTPGRATYSASKHALHGYFEGLRAELHATDISISIACPGYIRTEIVKHAVTGSGDEHGGIDIQHVDAMRADVFARKAVRQMARKKPVFFIGGMERFAPWIERISPALMRFAMPRVIKLD